VFEAIKQRFVRSHPQANVLLNFAGSQTLRTQIINGARAHVYASANPMHMEALVRTGRISASHTFATNRLVVVVPAKGPSPIERLADLPRAKRLVIAERNVPAGRYTQRMLEQASRSSHYGASFDKRVMARVVSRETNVRQTLQKVVLGEADAAIVYATDAASAAGAVRTIPIDENVNVIARYPIAVVDPQPSGSLASAFVAFVGSEAGRAELRRHGFSPTGKGGAG
jgi:molybdate transport system substrate-binding protein